MKGLCAVIHTEEHYNCFLHVSYHRQAGVDGGKEVFMAGIYQHIHEQEWMCYRRQPLYTQQTEQKEIFCETSHLY